MEECNTCRRLALKSPKTAKVIKLQTISQVICLEIYVCIHTCPVYKHICVHTCVCTIYGEVFYAIFPDYMYKVHSGFCRKIRKSNNVNTYHLMLCTNLQRTLMSRASSHITSCLDPRTLSCSPLSLCPHRSHCGPQWKCEHALPPASPALNFLLGWSLNPAAWCCDHMHAGPRQPAASPSPLTQHQLQPAAFSHFPEQTLLSPASDPYVSQPLCLWHRPLTFSLANPFYVLRPLSLTSSHISLPPDINQVSFLSLHFSTIL